MGVIEDLGRGKAGIDTSIFIYFIEEHSRFLSLVEPIFAEVAQGTREIATSALTLLEVLIIPYRNGDMELAGRYEAILTNSRGLELRYLTHEQLRVAARLRAATGMKTPDAVQVAAALSAGCATFLTNDRRIPEVNGMRVLQISDYATTA